MSPYNKLNVQIEVKVLFKINYIRNINFLKVSTKKRKNTQILKFHALKLKILADVLFFFPKTLAVIFLNSDSNKSFLQ